MTTGSVRALLLVIASLSAGLISLWVDQQGHWQHLVWHAPAAISPDLKMPAALASLPDTPPPSYTSVLERPLFAPDRKPPPPPAPPPPPDPLADIQLYGVFSGNNPGILARVEGKVRRFTVNQTLGAWTLTGIDGRTATFAKDGEKRELKLAYAPLGVRSPAPDTASPPAIPASGIPRAPASLISITPNRQDEARETLRRRNEIRAARGLPLVTE